MGVGVGGMLPAAKQGRGMDKQKSEICYPVSFPFQNSLTLHLYTFISTLLLQHSK